ncbi:AAA family ATPase [Marinobacterium aestuariivivens]|uniref:AAA family ATPase n=1 Tax=Marinobacterium aestuariivivens TaxID=1698799 RepID=A0ABW2A945_9GAMM
MRRKIEQAVSSVSTLVLGKDSQIRMALTCLFSQGHLLIEDLPGMGKTTLAHGLAQVLGLSFQRVQFTSDMLPADIIGVSIFDQQASAFRFHPGPVFTQLLLADEINRTTPKTQSALLEAMEERQVTLDGETHLLPEPFFVIATQNPITQFGTFPLPESQLDRFLMRIELGYPAPEAERQLLSEGRYRRQQSPLPVCIDLDDLNEIREACRRVRVSDSLIDYLQRLVQYSREAPQFAYGVSPRGSLALLQCARTWAYMQGREYVVPEDVQTLLEPVIGHRLRAAEQVGGHGSEALIRQMLEQVDVVG